MPYRNATICLNGHVVSPSKSNAETFCSQCGNKTYSVCPQCNSPIRGLYDVEGVVVVGHRDYQKPYYCYNCGSPYPWTQKILDNAVELLSLDDELDSSSKELIKSAIPDLIVDTPTTPIAIAKYRKGIANAGQIIKDSLRQLLIDVISETAKKTLFP
ncbi:MAG TPA: DUF2321 domain-containing protein [Bacteroides fragilis]|nr:DUF2321 domain-containing protein [Bacteroides fragilis]